MPVYAIKTPKGVYRVEAPKGSRDEDLIATLQHQVPEAFVKPQGDALGDFGNYLKQGAVASTQSITDIAGLNNPASQWLEKQKQGIKFSEAAKAKQSEADYYNQASKGKGVLREGLGALQSFAANPEALAGQAVGSLAPFALPVAAGVAAASAPVTAPVAAGLAGLATVGGGALGAAAGAGGMKRSMYDAVKEELTNAGVDPKEAEAAAQKAGAYSGSNAALLGGGALLGILGGVTGLTGTAAKTITSRVAATLAAKKVGEEVAEGAAERVVAGAAAKEAGKSIGKEMLKDVGVEASTEALENAYQQLGTNVALSGAGVETSPWKGVASEAVTGGLGGAIAGGVAGAGLHAITSRNERIAELNKGETAPAAGEEAPASERVQAFMRMGRTRAEAEGIVAAADARDAKLRGETDATGENAVGGGTEPVVRSAGRKKKGGAGAAEAPATEAGGVGGAEPTAGGPAIAEAGADAALAKEAAPYVAPARSKTYVDIKNAIDAAPPLPEGIKAPKVTKADRDMIHDQVVASEGKITPAQAYDDLVKARVEEQLAKQETKAAEVALPPQNKIDPVTLAPASVVETAAPPQKQRARKAKAEAIVAGATMEDADAVERAAVVATDPETGTLADPSKPQPPTEAEQDYKQSVNDLLDKDKGGGPNEQLLSDDQHTVIRNQLDAGTNAEILLGQMKQAMVLAAAEREATAKVAPPEVQPGEVAPTEARPEVDTRKEAKAAYDAIMAEVPKNALPKAKREAAERAMAAFNAIMNPKPVAEVAPALTEPTAPPIEEAPSATEPPLPADLAAMMPGEPPLEGSPAEPVDMDAFRRRVEETQAKLVGNDKVELPELQEGFVEPPAQETDLAKRVTNAKNEVANLHAALRDAPELRPIIEPQIKEATKVWRAASKAANAKVVPKGTKPTLKVKAEPKAKAKVAPKEKEAAPKAEAVPKPKVEASEEVIAKVKKFIAEGEEKAKAELKVEAEKPKETKEEKVVKAKAKLKQSVSADKKVRQQLQRKLDAEKAGAGVTDLPEDTAETGIDSQANTDAILDQGGKDDQKVATFISKSSEPFFNTTVLPMLTSGMTDLLEASGIPGIRKAAIETAQLANGFREGLMKEFARIEKVVTDFTNKHGSDELADLMSVAKSARVDPLAHATAAESEANDPALRDINKAKTDGSAFTKKNTIKKEYKDAEDRRKEEIKFVYEMKDALAKQPGGMEAYKEVRDFHANTRDMILYLRENKLKGLEFKDQAEIEKVIDLFAEQMDPESYNSTPDGKDAIYSMVNARDMPKVYFPSKRYGHFWLSIKDSPAGRQYHLFETKAQRDAVKREFARIYGKGIDDREFFSQGDTRNNLMETMGNDEEVVRQMIKIIDKYEGRDKTVLRDALFQSYLKSLPERSLSKNMIHYKDITGASRDVVRNFSSTAEQMATMLTGLRYRGELDTRFSQIEDYIQPPDGTATRFDARTTDRLSKMVKTMHERNKIAFEPADQNRLINASNRLAVVMFMTSPATAVANALATVIRVYPHLLAEHGPVMATKLMVKYGNLFDSIGMEKVGKKGKLELAAPSMTHSNLVRSNPNLQWAAKYAEQRNLFATGTDLQIGNRPSMKKDAFSVLDTGMRKATDVMTFALNTSERVTRESTYFMAFEAQMAKENKKGGTLDERRLRAATYANKMLGDTIGNPSATEYPKVLQTGMGRMLGLFKRFSFQQTKFFLGSVYSAADHLAQGNPKEFAKITAELGTSLGMVSLFSGAVGLPAYGMLMLMIDQWDDKFLTDEQKAARFQQYGYAGMNADMRFRYHMLPKLFGGAEYTGLDGFPHSYANTVMNGFVSESTGLNIGTRVGVDGLWFRGFQPGDDLLGTATNTLVANIAPISAQANMVKGIDDMQQGEYVRGFEKMTPAAFKGLFTAYRLSTEGARTRNRKTMMEADDFTGMNLFGVIGGVQPTRLSTIQSNRIKIANQVRDADKERDALMDRFKGNVIDFEKDPKAFAETVHKMRQFNAKYPLPGTMITDETIGKSLEATIRDRNATFFGTTMNKNNWMYIMPTLLASVPVEKRDAMGVGP